MTLIVKTVTRLTVGLILLYGIYVVLSGHMDSGGGFTGGVIIALSFIHIMLAFGRKVALQKFSQGLASILGSSAMLLFLYIGLLGLWGGHFFSNFYLRKGEPFSLFSAGIIPLCNIAISLNVGAGLFAIFAALVLFRSLGEKE